MRRVLHRQASFGSDPEGCSKEMAVQGKKELRKGKNKKDYDIFLMKNPHDLKK